MESACCAEMEEHLKGCARCRAMLAELKWTIEACHKTPAAEVPPKVSAAMRIRLREERQALKAADVG